ncbi:rplM [Wigglesworthia glossinidia endosymbiont of Glossina brevipalpis]|uniref:Large ribosomal subunit protein uL13 n=1 Tax=Wigglesworthia glossinidia brevipalpis TaxID=36870 RepID=RL13_WIGBR|nr:RecName: Full=Large ribosomal subunit protein uL13; AltName: Full=50S ribosomal protein L13 [Wigglesworthia glossinidia endosymbiont of Glossina brevipalpis]BAC24286.1 rplM [Wigglesworthia glossinidia endosymbiont of Glossina brevipalpis]
MKTFMLKKNIARQNWHIFDAKNKILGRFSTKLASILKGKNDITYTPHVDSGNYVIVINSKKIKITGKKLKNKFYYHHTGYSGGIKKISLENMIKNNSELVIYKSVKGMLPKGSLGRVMIKKLKIFSGESHNHEAQKPKKLLT